MLLLLDSYATHQSDVFVAFSISHTELVVTLIVVCDFL